MDVRKEVQKVWQSRAKRERRVVHSLSKGSPDADLRIRCMVVLSLVRGERPTCVRTILNCSRSHVYRIASRWIEELTTNRHNAILYYEKSGMIPCIRDILH